MATPTAETTLLARLEAYQAASNRYDIDTPVAMFTEDGCIEFGGKQYRGQAALRAAHEYDQACLAQITFSNFTVAGNVVACHTLYCDELDRAVGLDGTHSRAEFTFEGDRIRRFLAHPPDEAERKRHHQAKAVFRQWAQQHYPDEVAKGFAFDYASGVSLFKVVQAWRASQAPQPD